MPRVAIEVNGVFAHCAPGQVATVASQLSGCRQREVSCEHMGAVAATVVNPAIEATCILDEHTTAEWPREQK